MTAVAMLLWVYLHVEPVVHFEFIDIPGISCWGERVVAREMKWGFGHAGFAKYDDEWVYFSSSGEWPAIVHEEE